MDLQSSEIDKEEDWDIVVGGVGSTSLINFRALWNYRDLLLMFVKRDIVTVYKQTVLGPIWFVLQPLFTTLIFVILFGRVAGLSPDGVPQFAFYLLGISLWSYFSDVLTITSKTFTDNANIFGKVYFPRLILPLSKVISGFVKFLMQFCFFLVFWLYYLLVTKEITIDWHILFAPLVMVVIVLFALGSGILITSLTTKYRDLSFLITFGIQLMMYATPVAYAMSNAKMKQYLVYIWLNPLTSLFEAFRFGILGKGTVDLGWLAYSVVFTIVLLMIGISIFNRVEKKFIDTV